MLGPLQSGSAGRLLIGVSVISIQYVSKLKQASEPPSAQTVTPSSNRRNGRYLFGIAEQPCRCWGLGHSSAWSCVWSLFIFCKVVYVRLGTHRLSLAVSCWLSETFFGFLGIPVRSIGNSDKTRKCPSRSVSWSML